MIPLLAATVLLQTAPKPAFADLAYVPDGGASRTLDLYLPANAGAKTPLIVYIHGGAFAFGSKAASPLVPFRELARGYAIASINYRLSGEAPFPAALDDCKAAVRWLRTHAAEYKLDADRFVAWGESAGANLAALVGTTGATDPASAVQGVVDYYGPTDFLRMDAKALPNSLKHDPADSPESRYLGAAIQTVPDVARRANPIAHVGPDTPPFFVAHGTADHTVPFNQSELLVAALKGAGRRVTFFSVDGADHVFKGITPLERRSLDAATDRFLDRVLKG